MKKVASVVLGLFAVVAVAACGASGDEVGQVEGIEELEDGIVDGNDSSTFFIVTHPDYRKCAYPMCGGWFVKRVNRASTRCADGKYADECHVLALDLSPMGIVGDQRYEVEGEVGMSQALVRGSIEIEHDELGHEVATLVASEAWVGGAKSEATGVFYRTELNGVKCITWPCPSFDETKLNSTAKTKAIAELDLAASGADETALEAGYAELTSPDGVLVVGLHKTIKGPGGKGTVLVATEFYTQVVPAPVDDRNPATGACVKNSNDSCNTDADCVAGGCGGELCFNPESGGGISTCECTQPQGVSCGCVNGSCTWWQ